MNWRRASYDVMTLHTEDGEYAGYYVVRHKTSHGPYYNGWHGDFRDRDIREYVSAGFDRDAVMAACERRSERIAGPRFVSIDLDVVITGDLRPLWNRR